MSEKLVTRPLRFALYTPDESVAALRHRVAKAGVPAVTRDDLVEDLLRFANARGVAFRALIDDALEEWARKVDAALSAGSGVAQTGLFDYMRETAPIVQAWVRDELVSIFMGDRGPMLRLDAARPGVSAASPIDGPVVMESLVRGRTLQHFAFRSLEDFAQWAVTQVRDPAQPYAAALCRCRWEECGDFFTAIDSATRTRRLFCKDGHMKLHHKKDAALRVAASRAGMTAADYRAAQATASRNGKTTRRRHK